MKDRFGQHKAYSFLERVSKFLGGEPQNREQLIRTLRRAQQRHLLSSDMLDMIERILQVSDMQVREIMIPKDQMVVVRKNTDFSTILPIVIESAHSRFPIMDESGKDVVGMLLAKDLLRYASEKNFSSSIFPNIIRPAVFTPQSKRVDILLREFRTNRNHIAIVLDEYGHVVGLVTLEDALEQIVGDIEDEYDLDEDEESDIKSLDDGSYIVKGKTLVSEFNQYFNMNLPNETNEKTLSHLIQQHFDHLPKRGDSLSLGGFNFKVLHSDKHRIYLLEVNYE